VGIDGLLSLPVEIIESWLVRGIVESRGAVAGKHRTEDGRSLPAAFEERGALGVDAMLTLDDHVVVLRLEPVREALLPLQPGVDRPLRLRRARQAVAASATSPPILLRASYT
jgi:hypothetical protein